MSEIHAATGQASTSEPIRHAARCSGRIAGLGIGGRVPENVAEYLPNIIGFVAGILSITSFAPQVYKAWREGTQSISLRMYLTTVTSFTLWTIYGLLLNSPPLIIFNALSLMMSGTILVLKLRNLKNDKRASSAAA
ncbi:MAG: PQ-loop domain-containing transporter [Beijerinckiaceae bacterium]|jgi:MtN3 and saliva related transmembrane protein